MPSPRGNKDDVPKSVSLRASKERSSKWLGLWGTVEEAQEHEEKVHAVYEKLNEEEEEHVHAKDVWRKAAKKAVETTAHKRLMSKMTSSTHAALKAQEPIAGQTAGSSDGASRARSPTSSQRLRGLISPRRTMSGFAGSPRSPR